MISEDGAFEDRDPGGTQLGWNLLKWDESNNLLGLHLHWGTKDDAQPTPWQHGLISSKHRLAARHKTLGNCRNSRCFRASRDFIHLSFCMESIRPNILGQIHMCGKPCNLFLPPDLDLSYLSTIRTSISNWDLNAALSASAWGICLGSASSKCDLAWLQIFPPVHHFKARWIWASSGTLLTGRGGPGQTGQSNMRAGMADETQRCSPIPASSISAAFRQACRTAISVCIQIRNFTFTSHKILPMCT